MVYCMAQNESRCRVWRLHCASRPAKPGRRGAASGLAAKRQGRRHHREHTCRAGAWDFALLIAALRRQEAGKRESGTQV